MNSQREAAAGCGLVALLIVLLVFAVGYAIHLDIADENELKQLREFKAETEARIYQP